MLIFDLENKRTVAEKSLMWPITLQSN